MNEQNQKFTPSRRNLMRFTALSAIAAGTVTAINTTHAAATENNSVFPADFSYPDLAGPSLALWGSSSLEGARADEGVPKGFDARLHVLLSQYLSAPVLGFGRGGETSSNIVCRRGVSNFVAKIQFPNDIIPASGSVYVTLQNDNIAWNASTYYPGYVQDIPGVLKAVEGAEGSYVFTRMVDGTERYAPSDTTANRFYSYQEQISRGSYHLIQVGRNNLAEFDLLREQTQAAFDLSPYRTIVMGHFTSGTAGKDSDHAKQVSQYNTWAAETYGNKFINPQQYLRETTKETWLRYGDLAGSGVWNSKDDTKDYEAGRPPRSLYASDRFHLNGWGYLALARQIESKVRELGWF